MNWEVTLVLILFLLLSDGLTAQTRLDPLMEELLKARNEGKVYYSQFDYYAPRDNKLVNSTAKEKLGKDLMMYGLDFYYASGTWLTRKSIFSSRKNLVYIVKTMWKKHKAVPVFSWHLENPYVPSDYREYMGCRYTPMVAGYPMAHSSVVNEILTNMGTTCGRGNISRTDNVMAYRNPRAWFDARCEEVASIIKQLVDDGGQPIPVIFRLWHECEDSWQWWGAKFNSAEDYKKFFVLTEQVIMRNAPGCRILWCYCPDRYWKTEEEYLKRYPGDDFVDILGFDDYSIGTTDANLQETIRKARLISRMATDKGKVSAIMETDNAKASTSEVFFKQYVDKILTDSKVSLSIFQVWSTGKLFTKKQVKDRKAFLRRKNVIVAE